MGVIPAQSMMAIGGTTTMLGEDTDTELYEYQDYDIRFVAFTLHGEDNLVIPGQLSGTSAADRGAGFVTELKKLFNERIPKTIDEWGGAAHSYVRQDTSDTDTEPDDFRVGDADASPVYRPGKITLRALTGVVADAYEFQRDRGMLGYLHGKAYRTGDGVKSRYLHRFKWYTDMLVNLPVNSIWGVFLTLPEQITDSQFEIQQMFPSDFDWANMEWMVRPPVLTGRGDGRMFTGADEAEIRRWLIADVVDQGTNGFRMSAPGNIHTMSLWTEKAHPVDLTQYKIKAS